MQSSLQWQKPSPATSIRCPISSTTAAVSQAFDIYQAGYPANEFTGLPVAEDLMRQMNEQFQAMLEGDITVDDMLETTQESWSAEF